MPKRGMKPKKACMAHIQALGASLLMAGMMAPASAMDQTLAVRDHGHLALYGGEFAKVMSASGDWLAVGIPGTVYDLATNYRGGRVMLWKREAGTWKLKQVLVSPEFVGDATAYEFGKMLAMDNGRLLVAAPQFGWVHAFRLDGEQWTGDGLLRSAGSHPPGPSYGSALMLSGDLAIIGDPGAKMVNGGAKAGRVEIFQRRSSGWVNVARLTDPDLQTLGFGSSLALHGTTLYTGVPDSGSGGEGKVAVFRQSGSDWNWTRDMHAPPGGGSIGFGKLLQVSEGRLFVADAASSSRVFEYAADTDEGPLAQISVAAGSVFCVNRDRLAVFSGGATSVSASTGVSLFRRVQNQGWTPEASVPLAPLGLGMLRSVSWSGDELLIGGHTSGPPHAATNVVQVMRQQAGIWTLEESLSPLPYLRLREADYGRSVSASESWLAVGGPFKGYHDLAGMVFMHRKSPDGKFGMHSLLPAPVIPGLDLRSFGRKVVSSGERVAVGNQKDGVVVYAHDSSSDTWRQEAALMPSAGWNRDGFGHAMAMQGDLLVIGAFYDRKVCVYRHGDDGWQQEALLAPPSSSTSGNFGEALSLDGERLLVGAPDGGSGTAYVFERQSGQWNLAAKLEAPKTIVRPGVPAASDFGGTVALSGSHAMVGREGGLVASERVEGGWKPGRSIQLPDGLSSVYRPNLGLSGRTAIVSTVHFAAAFGFLKNEWALIPQALTPGPGLMYSQALFQNQIFLGVDGRTVRILDLTRPPLFSPKGDVTLLNVDSRWGTLDAGEHLPNADVKRLVAITATHQGTVPVSYTITTSGHVGDFVLTKQRLVLEPNNQDVVEMRFKPQGAGERRLVVTFTPEVPGLPAASYEIIAHVVTQPSFLQFTETPTPGIYGPDEFPGLHARVAGTRPWAFRWLKNGRVIPGETSASLWPKEGGTYQVEVSNPHGKLLSGSVPLGFYRIVTPEVVALKGRSSKCVLSISGPGMQVRWTREQGPVEEGREFSGTRTPVLTVKHSRQSEGFYAELTMSGLEEGWNVQAPLSLHAVSPPEIVSDLDYESKWLLGEEGSRYFGLQYEGPSLSPAVFSFRGLPPGLKADETGNIYGIPTTAGVHTFQITATVDGLTTSKSYRLVVTRMGVTPGIYWGWLQPSDDLPEAGAVVLDLQPSGSYSGTIQLGMSRTSVAGVLQAAFDEKPVTKAFPVTLLGRPQVFWIEVLTDKRLGIQVRDVETTDDMSVLMSEPALIKAHGSQDVVGSMGSYNFGLLCRDFGGFNELVGNGFGTLRVSADRRVTYAGQLPDGSAVTGTTWLSGATTDSDDAERVYFYQGDAKTRALLRGAVKIKSDEPEVSRRLEWQRPPSRGRVYADGVQPRELTFVASRYSVPANAALLPGTAQQIEFSALNTFLSPVPFTLTRQHRAVFGPGAANPLQTRLSFYAPTGFFTGQFTLRDEDPANSARILTRTVQYRGMLLPELGVGAGYFLLPSLPDPSAEPPTTLNSSPIVSGSVWIEPMAP